MPAPREAKAVRRCYLTVASYRKEPDLPIVNGGYRGNALCGAPTCRGRNEWQMARPVAFIRIPEE